MQFKSILSILLILCILGIGSFSSNTALGDDHAMNPAVERLRTLGFDVDEQVLQESENQTMFGILLDLGMGDYNYDTGEWTPTSSQVYAFDAEVYDIEHMYRLFLQGVQSIVPEVVISDIQEDLSQMTDEMIPSKTTQWMQTDGKRTVSFLCNNHPYSIVLESWGDWINMNMLDFMNHVLEKEGCPNRLHIITDDMDQLVIMIYSTQERADIIKPLINVH